LVAARRAGIRNISANAVDNSLTPVAYRYLSLAAYSAVLTSFAV
jgi:hypothetical protein